MENCNSNRFKGFEYFIINHQIKWRFDDDVKCERDSFERVESGLSDSEKNHFFDFDCSSDDSIPSMNIAKQYEMWIADGVLIEIQFEFFNIRRVKWKRSRHI